MRCYPNPPEIPAAYCSLLQFGAIFAALQVATPEQLVAEANHLRVASALPGTPPANAALRLAAFLISAAEAQRPFLVFLAAHSLISYTQRLGHLIGGSLAQEGPGLFPIAGDVPRNTDMYEDDAAFVLLNYPGDTDAELAETRSRFQSHGTPFLQMEISRPFDLLAESFKGELAAILGCARLGLDPFDVSDNRAPRVFANEILEQISQQRNIPPRTPRLVDGVIQLYAEGTTLREISSLNMAEAMRSFLRIPRRHAL